MKLVLHPRQQRPFLPLSVFTLFLMGFYLTRSNRGISLSFPLSFMVACFNTWLALFICHLSEGRLGRGHLQSIFSMAFDDADHTCGRSCVNPRCSEMPVFQPSTLPCMAGLISDFTCLFVLQVCSTPPSRFCTS